MAAQVPEAEVVGQVRRRRRRGSRVPGAEALGQEEPVREQEQVREPERVREPEEVAVEEGHRRFRQYEPFERSASGDSRRLALDLSAPADP